MKLSSNYTPLTTLQKTTANPVEGIKISREGAYVPVEVPFVHPESSSSVKNEVPLQIPSDFDPFTVTTPSAKLQNLKSNHTNAEYISHHQQK